MELSAQFEDGRGGRLPTKIVGADNDLPVVLLDQQVLFGEDHGRAIVSAPPDHKDEVIGIAQAGGVAAVDIGAVGEPSGRLEIQTNDAILSVAVDDLTTRYANAIAGPMQQVPTPTA